MAELLRRARRHPVLGRLLVFRPLAVALAILFVMATATATAEAPTGSVIYGKLDTEDVRLSMPATKEPKGIAVFFHGQNGHVDNRMDEPWLQSLVRSGWIVAASDFHTDSWGNEVSTEDTRRLVEWAEEQSGGIPVRMFVSGSMGGSVSLNAMIHGVEAPACWYGVKPAVDMTTMGNVPGANRIISEAYGGKVPADRNPVDNIDKLSPTTRYRMVSSPADTWVPRVSNSDRLSAGLREMGAEVTILTVNGTHDDPSHFDAADLVEFAETCAS